MNMKSIVYSGFLLLGLVIASVFMTNGRAQGVSSSADVGISVVDSGNTTSTTHILGQSVHFQGSVSFANGEQNTLSSVRLANTTGNQALDVILPLVDTDGGYVELGASATTIAQYSQSVDSNGDPTLAGSVMVKVTHTNVQSLGNTAGSTAGGTVGTVGCSTIGGTAGTVGGCGWQSDSPVNGIFKGLASGANIAFDVIWTPPTFIEPRPEFTLIPDADVVFQVPDLPEPTQVSAADALPNSNLVYAIPQAGSPTTSTAISTVLPAVSATSTTSSYAVPVIQADTNIAGNLARLPALDGSKFYFGYSGTAIHTGTVSASNPAEVAGFTVPTITTATSNAADFPTTTNFFSSGIPTTSADTSGVTGVPNAGSATDLAISAGGVSGANTALRGIAYDATDSTFWVIMDDTGSGGVDQIIEINAAGDTVVTAAIDAPSDNVEGIAVANDTLFVLENGWAEGEDGSHRVFKFSLSTSTGDATTVPSSGSSSRTAWNTASDDRYQAKNNEWSWFNGMHADGNSSSASLWLSRDSGDMMFKMSQSGKKKKEVWLPWLGIQFSAVGYSAQNNVLYAFDSNESELYQFTLDGDQIGNATSITNSSGDTDLSDVQGMAIRSVSNKDIIHLATDSGDVFRTYVPGSEEPDEPRGIAYSSSTVQTSADQDKVWVVIDGTPADKILKIATTGVAVTSGWGAAGNGRVDAPNTEITGITYTERQITDSDDVTGYEGRLFLVGNPNNERHLYEISAASGSLVNSWRLDTNTYNVWDNLGAITSDGNKLYLAKQDWNGLYQLTLGFDSDGEVDEIEVEDKWGCCPSEEGGDGIAFHSEREQVFVVKSSNVTVYNISDLNSVVSEYSLQGDTGQQSISNVEGATFDGDTLYITHDDGYVSYSFLATSVSDDPQAITYTPSGTTGVGEALWAIVDGTNKDVLMKIATTSTSGTGALITNSSFPSAGTGDTGWIEAPTNTITAMAYLAVGGNPYLWMFDGDNRNLYKIDATNGTLSESYNLQNNMNFWGEIGGMTAKGTKLHLFGQYDNVMYTFNPADESEAVANMIQSWPDCCPDEWGQDAFAYHVGTQRYFTAKNNSMIEWTSELKTPTTLTVKIDGSNIDSDARIKGMTFNGDVVYLAYKDADNSGKIVRSKIAPESSSDAVGLAYSPPGSAKGGAQINEAVWILVDSSPYDILIKSNATTGTVINDTYPSASGDTFPSRANNVGYVTLDGQNNIPAVSDGNAITFDADGYLWIAAVVQDGCCNTQRKLIQIDATNGEEESSYDLNQIPWEVTITGLSMSADGATIYMFGHGGWDPRIYTFNVSNQTTSDAWGTAFARAATLRPGTNQLFLSLAETEAQISQFVMNDSGFGNIESGLIANYEVEDDYSVTDVKGLVIKDGSTNTTADTNPTNDVLYIARTDEDANGDKTGYITKVHIPADASTIPTDMAYSAAHNHLYTVLEAKGNSPASVNVTAPGSDSIIYSFELPEAGLAMGAAIRTVTTTDADDVTTSADYLYVSVGIANDCHPGGWCGLNKHVLYGFATANVAADSTAGTAAITRGDQVSSVDVPEWVTFNQVISGLTYDGEYLVATMKDGLESWGMNSFVRIDCETGQRVEEVWMYDPSDWSYFAGNGSVWSDVSYDESEEVFYFTRDKEVVKISVDGRKIGDPWDVSGIGGITGLIVGEFSGDKYVYFSHADSGTNEIDRSLVPVPQTVISRQPIGLTMNFSTSSSAMFVAVNAVPKDKITKVNLSTDSAGTTTASLDTSWADGGMVNSRGMKTNGLAYVPAVDDQATADVDESATGTDYIYVLINDERFFEVCMPGTDMCKEVQGSLPSVHKLNAATGEFVSDFTVRAEGGSGLGTSPPWGGAGYLMGIEGSSITAVPSYVTVTSEAGVDSEVVDKYRLVIGFNRPIAPFSLCSGDGFCAEDIESDDKEMYILTLDPGADEDGNGPIGEVSTQFNGSMPLLEQYSALAYTTGVSFTDEQRLVSAGQIDGQTDSSTVTRFGLDNVMAMESHPVYDDGDVTSGGQLDLEDANGDSYDITGLVYDANSGWLYMANAGAGDVGLNGATDDGFVGTIVRTKLPDNTGVELTVIDDYAANITATVGGTAFSAATAASYAIAKNEDLRVLITSPVADFVSTTTEATVTGYVNDPTVTTLDAGYTLPFTKFIEDTVTAASGSIFTASTGGDSNWHLTCADDTETEANEELNPFNMPFETVESGNCAWRFGTPGEGGFENGDDAASGTLTSAETVDVGTDTKLTFYTGYVTETMADIDVKLIEVAIVTSDAQGNDTVGSYSAIGQVIGANVQQFIDPCVLFGPMSFECTGIDPNYQPPNMGGGGGYVDPNMGGGGGYVDPNMGGGGYDPSNPGGGGGYVDPNMGGDGGYVDPNMGGGGDMYGGADSLYGDGTGGGMDMGPADDMYGDGTGGMYGDDMYGDGTGGGMDMGPADDMYGTGGMYGDDMYGDGTGGGMDMGPADDMYGTGGMYGNDEGDDESEGVTINKASGFKYHEVEPLFITQELQKVEIDLSGYNTKKIKIRFRFDSSDEWANDGEGWFIDDIEVSGKGTVTGSVPTVLLVDSETGIPAPVEVGDTTYYRSFTTTVDLVEGQNDLVTEARLAYSPYTTQPGSVSGYVDYTEPELTTEGLDEASNVVAHTLKGTVSDNTVLSNLKVEKISNYGESDESSVTVYNKSKFAADFSGDWETSVSLSEGVNTIKITATDHAALATSTIETITLDTTPPDGTAKTVTLTSEDEALVGDNFFINVAAADSSSGVDRVYLSSNGVDLQEVAEAPAILVQMHGLAGTTASPNTHANLYTVGSGTPVGLNTWEITILDKAGNTATTTASLEVTSKRTNRNYFLLDGFNYMGVGLIPDEPSLIELMKYPITDKVSDDFKAHLQAAWTTVDDTSTTDVDESKVVVTLADIIETVSAFSLAGEFQTFTPGPAADTLSNIEAFQGMTIKALTQIDEDGDVTTTDDKIGVFKEAAVEGFTATQKVPIRYNIEGVFFKTGELPPDKELRVGYNLVAPHILSATPFTTVMRGALIPKELAVSALTFERSVSASVDSEYKMNATIQEMFSANSASDLLKPEFSYWTFIVDDPDDTRVNSEGDPKGPTLTP